MRTENGICILTVAEHTNPARGASVLKPETNFDLVKIISQKETSTSNDAFRVCECECTNGSTTVRRGLVLRWDVVVDHSKTKKEYIREIKQNKKVVEIAINHDKMAFKIVKGELIAA